VTTTLVLPEHLEAILREWVELDLETGAVLLARAVTTSDGVKLLGTHLIPVPDEAYEIREVDSLQIGSRGYVPPLRLAEESQSVPIWLHTHPGNGSSPKPSRHDRVVDTKLQDLFRLRSGSDYYGELVISHTSSQLRFSGHLATKDETIEIDRLLTIGSRIALTWNDSFKRPTLGTLFDRNIRAFGGAVQSVVQDLRVAIIGCGGTGSAVAEQLVRLGVRRFMLFDPDKLTESNLTRVYGSTPEDVGRMKVNVLADQILMIAPGAKVEPIESAITNEGIAKRLVDVDIAFGCTDDNAGRPT
jgi:hypothetical protein